jgi:hypothetical protein
VGPCPCVVGPVCCQSGCRSDPSEPVFVAVFLLAIGPFLLAARVLPLLARRAGLHLRAALMRGAPKSFDDYLGSFDFIGGLAFTIGDLAYATAWSLNSSRLVDVAALVGVALVTGCAGSWWMVLRGRSRLVKSRPARARR